MSLDPDKMMEEIAAGQRYPIKAAPLVRAEAKREGVDLSLITGTGKKGFITKDDYENYTGNKIKVNKASKTKHPMNHLTDDTETIGGMDFKRTRTGFDHSGKKSLDIPDRFKNNELEYRWVNDVGGRVENLKEYGYQLVDAKALSKDEAISVRRRTDTNKDGSDLYSILMATPKKWFKDRQEKADEQRRSQLAGQFTKPTDEKGEVLGDEFYNKGSQMTS